MTEIGIKYKCEWIKRKELANSEIMELNSFRNKFYDLKMIGEGNDGIGYGNISLRYKNDQFIISGATTGKIKNLKIKTRK